MKFVYKLLLTAILGFITPGLTNAQTYYFEQGDSLRKCIVHLPASYNSTVSYPLVFNFHGYSSNAIQEQAYTLMDNTADAGNFIVVYPEGLADGLGNRFWAVGFNESYATGEYDVDFVRMLIDTFMQMYSLNTNRIYACGMSNGGYFSNRLACELGDRIAAIAGVTGLMTDTTYNHCLSAADKPVLQIHGTNDPVVNYNGIFNSLSAEETVAFWQMKNTCGGISDTTPFADVNTADASTAALIKFYNCTSNSEVWFVKIENGGHTWPGGLIDIPTNGATNRDFSASSLIWDFFSRYDINGYTGLHEVQNTPTAVYPNPFTNSLQIENTAIREIRLYDLWGNKIITSVNKTINTSCLERGIYFLIVESKAGTTESFKLLKK